MKNEVRLLTRKESIELLGLKADDFDKECEKERITVYKKGKGSGTRYYYSEIELEVKLNCQKKIPVYDKLDLEEIRSRMSESFPSVYLTMISIIQGLAFGILVNTFFMGIFNEQSPIHLQIESLLLFITTFAIIIAITFEYVWFVGIYRWTPSISDILIPFMLGLFEISLSLSIGNPGLWWFLAGILAIVSIFAFFNTFYNCKENMFVEKEVYKYTKSSIKKDMFFSFILSAIAFSCWLIHFGIDVFEPQLIVGSIPGWVPFFLLFVFFIVALMFKGHNFVSRLFLFLGVSR